MLGYDPFAMLLYAVDEYEMLLKQIVPETDTFGNVFFVLIQKVRIASLNAHHN